MLSAEIRQSFLDFFAGQDHKVLPSSSLIPHEDTSVLFTVAGMQQFKPYYSGMAKPPARRIATAQKCFRTNDLEEVGDYSHLTFFEMLGNFAFGDYFKEGAIEMAWEYLTRRLSLDPAKLQPTIYPGDEEAAAIWRRVAERQPHPLDDNFWPEHLEGWVGPCGPDSHVYFDWGPSVGCGREDCYPDHCDRYLEVWNLVFPQYDRQPDGAMPPLQPPGIDTGLGLERTAAVVQGVLSIHQTDVFKSLNDHFRERASAPDAEGEPAAYARRLLADHSRGTAMLVADGVRPGNEGRGYVLRKMVRRATLHGVRRLGLADGLSGAVDAIGELMGSAYPEVVERAIDIRAVLAGEEASFRRTLESGEREFTGIAARSRGVISGEDAFRLHDTFGFPIELTAELAAEAGLKVDRQGFEARLAEQRQQSRQRARKTPVQRTGITPTEFLGYETLSAPGRVVRLFRGDGSVADAAEGDEVEAYLARTPMYAEAGGQVGDIGVLEGAQGTVEVYDVQKQGDAIAHHGRVTSGRIAVGDEVQAEVDEETRWATMRHHSATHLLHKALHIVLGETALQAGSYVGPETCTFDFRFERGVSRAEMDAVFGIVNRRVRDDLARMTRVMALAEARASGAMMLFGEKYGETVRVVSFGDFSSELCGGTHVDRTGQIGYVVPVAERSVGAGLRRIEFYAGERAERHQSSLRQAAETAATAMHVGPADLADRVEQLLAERKQLQKQVEEQKRKLLLGAGLGFDAGVETSATHGIPGADVRGRLVSQIIGAEDPKFIRLLADRLLDTHAEAEVAMVIARSGREATVVVKSRNGAGVSADELFRKVREVGGGKGGGDARLAQGGGFAEASIGAMVNAAEAAARGS